MDPVGVLLLIVAFFFIIVLFRSIKIVPQQWNYIIERLGKYRRTLEPGPRLLVPFVDNVRAKVDLRERVVNFPPQPVITADNLGVQIDTVLYYIITQPTAAVYNIDDYLAGVEQLTTTTLRNVVGSLDLEKTLTSREEINARLAAELDKATDKWGLKVTRVELRSIEPPLSIRDAMEKQMRAERDRRAAILNAEGTKRAAILNAEGEQQSAVLRAKGERDAAVLRADGEAKAIQTVFAAIHKAKPTDRLLTYQYLQTLPDIAQGSANKVWIVPSELTKALGGIGNAFGGAPDVSGEEEEEVEVDTSALELDDSAAQALEAAQQAAREVQDIGEGKAKNELPPV
ncbi:MULTISPECIES: SPFH domain-containing protein [Glycomyces]|jgi:regulator of protease activity HflC (stomatin/prohibitin superfamily)|uniref:Regulator of protease activity HflC (Stomatin/prohibitin superfamily) n=2 Tax=Glycomyces TaxID=58113 RepID=A0A9X3SWF5_9ACTN|nr:SPFH domain-containing protein [Glycomyces lechevalierae]MDA1387104.1 SPFH/Band 7/PHB domain protein [Glycomyces lechevalierae]MDR7336760.1 regulator of protease activity HflC (stomatin/prohibitin superfamily) [Glycomyces lechevalierae]